MERVANRINWLGVDRIIIVLFNQSHQLGRLYQSNILTCKYRLGDLYNEIN